jgi:hypothetical protein
LRPVIRERRLVATRRCKLAPRAAEQELDEAAARRNLDCLVNFAPRIFGDRLIWTLFIKLEFILSQI